MDEDIETFSVTLFVSGHDLPLRESIRQRLGSAVEYSTAAEAIETALDAAGICGRVGLLLDDEYATQAKQTAEAARIDLHAHGIYPEN